MTSTQRRAATLLLIALASCAGPPAATEAEDREQLLARIEQFNEAIREGDVEKYTDVFVDDFVFTWAPDGQIYAPEEIFPNVVPTPDHAPSVDELVVRIYGDAAIVNARMKQLPHEAGVRVTFSFARVESAWKVVAYQSTNITDTAG